VLLNYKFRCSLLVPHSWLREQKEIWHAQTAWVSNVTGENIANQSIMLLVYAQIATIILYTLIKTGIWLMRSVWVSQAQSSETPKCCDHKTYKTTLIINALTRCEHTYTQIEQSYPADVGMTVTSLSAVTASVAVSAAATAGTVTFFQSSPDPTISAINSPTAMSVEFSGFCYMKPHMQVGTTDIRLACIYKYTWTCTCIIVQHIINDVPKLFTGV